MSRTRRRFLELAGVGTGLALAGCLGGADSEATADGPATERTESTDRKRTEDESGANEDGRMSTVFHFTTEGESNQERAISNVSNLLEDGTTDTERVVLVVNSRGLDLVLEETSAFPDEVTRLLDEGVSIRACENTMAARDLTDDDLIDGVETVPAGVGELTKLQAKDGYAYIKTP
ncbi:DsrE family protein [Halegenticoccus tardaugens]|uniref:DsrE family protein n=1 Tax=Halegenticoccus tardaugens TaxID=2071624 RepID=UPI00100AC92D|nr:DsrE family protein [Halegenticoccus tardaugens]